jgi:hypothetical protein
LLSYFRINDPYRLIIIFIALILLRLPFLTSTDWITVQELKWMVVGEKVNDGALLYSELWDNCGLQAAWVYAFIDLIVGRSVLVYQIVTLLIFFLQIGFFNFIALKHKMYHENNYLPAFFSGILALSLFNILSLSPALMGLTFILFSINSLLNYIASRNKLDGSLINIGIQIGIASQFYLPYYLFLLVHVASLLFFTSTQQRRYLLLLYGVTFPSILIGLYYAWHGHLTDFLNNYFLSLFTVEPEGFMGLGQIFKVLGLSILLFLLASLKTLSSFGFNVFQARIQKIMFLCFLISAVIMMLYANKTGEVFIIFIPWTAFFLSHFFLSIRHKIKRELSFLIYFIAVLVLYFGFSFRFFRMYDHEQILVKKELPANVPYSEKRIVVLGPDIRPYYFAKVATPYLNWPLSKWQVEELNYYDNLESIDRNFRHDMPDYIVDQIDLAPRLFYNMPLLGAEYENVGRGIYRRKINN